MTEGMAPASAFSTVPDMLRAIELTTLAFDAAPERLRPSIRRLYLEMLEVMFRRKQAAVRAGIRKQSNQTAGTRRRGPTAVAD